MNKQTPPLSYLQVTIAHTCMMYQILTSIMSRAQESKHIIHHYPNPPSPGGAITVRLRCLKAIWRGDEQLWLQGLQSDQGERTQSYGQGSRQGSSVIGFTWRRAQTESSTIPCTHTHKTWDICCNYFSGKSQVTELFKKFPVVTEPGPYSEPTNPIQFFTA
jgi:hypothetical protein